MLASLGAALTVGAVALLVLAVGTAPAGNRNPTIFFDDFPGPDQVTFGKNVAYTTSLTNVGSSTYTHVFFTMNRPSTLVRGATVTADLVYASCEPSGPPFAGLTDTKYTCPEITQIPSTKPPAKAQVILVWRTPTPTNPETLDCAHPLVTDCTLTATGSWAIKDNQPGSNDTFPVQETTSLLLQPDQSKSGGYALSTVKKADCTTTSANLVTNLSVGALNKIATAICAGTLPGATLDPGVAIVIDETTTPYGPGITAMSTICIPKPGFECPLSSQTNSWVFNPTLATFIFKVPETADWPPGEKLDVAYHNGDSYSGCTFVRDNPTKIWTVTCPAAQNGDWRFG
jgi:hypothetical protein